MPVNPVKGRDNVQQFIASSTANWTATDWEIVYLVAECDVLFCERVDRTQFAEGGAEGLVTPRPPVTRRRAVAPLAQSLFLPKVVAAAIACSAGLGGAAPRCEASGFPNLWLSRSSSALASSNAT